MKEELRQIIDGYDNYNGIHSKEYMYEFLIEKKIKLLFDNLINKKIAKIYELEIHEDQSPSYIRDEIITILKD